MSAARGTNLVFIYGPPAVGKYTVAGALADELGWPLFHNHLAIDYVESLIKWGKPGFHEACADVRIALAERALANGSSFVTTFVYARGFDADEAYVQRLVDVATRVEARVCPVRLACSLEILQERCVAPHRAPMGKIATAEGLRAVLNDYDCFASIPGTESLEVDTQTNSVAQSVALIRNHFAL